MLRSGFCLPKPTNGKQGNDPILRVSKMAPFSGLKSHL